MFSNQDEEKNQDLTSERVSLEKLKEMPFLDAVVFETLRLFPPADIDAKQSSTTDTLPNGTVVPKGTTIIFDNL